MTVNIAKNMGLAQLKHIAIYGTKIKVNASNANLIDPKETQTIREILKRELKQTRKKTSFTSDLRGDQVPSELTSREKVHEIIQM